MISGIYWHLSFDLRYKVFFGAQEVPRDSSKMVLNRNIQILFTPDLLNIVIYSSLDSDAMPNTRFRDKYVSTDLMNGIDYDDHTGPTTDIFIESQPSVRHNLSSAQSRKQVAVGSQ